jgi:hypothetical protein
VPSQIPTPQPTTKPTAPAQPKPPAIVSGREPGIPKPPTAVENPPVPTIGRKPSKVATLADLVFNLPSAYEAFIRLIDGKDEGYLQEGQALLQVLQGAVSLVEVAGKLKGLEQLTKMSGKVGGTLGIVGVVLGVVNDLATVLNPKKSVREREEALKNIFITSADTAVETYITAALGPAALPFQALKWWLIKGFTLIREAHEAGHRESLDINYAEAWADTLLYGTQASNRPDIKEIEDSRNRGRADAFAFLSRLSDTQITELGNELKAKYGTEKKVKSALVRHLLKKMGNSRFELYAGTDDALFIVGRYGKVFGED